MMRAVVVLPTPRTPVSTKACAMRPVAMALDSVRTSASWPISSAKLRGPVLAREHAIGGWPASVMRNSVGHRVATDARTRWEAGRRPDRNSLRLLPSGPGRVGEGPSAADLPPALCGSGGAAASFAETIPGTLAVRLPQGRTRGAETWLRRHPAGPDISRENSASLGSDLAAYTDRPLPAARGKVLRAAPAATAPSGATRFATHPGRSPVPGPTG